MFIHERRSLGFDTQVRFETGKYPGQHAVTIIYFSTRIGGWRNEVATGSQSVSPFSPKWVDNPLLSTSAYKLIADDMLV
jgi:hypothetical protein